MNERRSPVERRLMKDPVLSVLDCGLEPQSHALVLAALAQFAQPDLFTRMSMTAMAVRGRQDPKTVGRILKRLADEDPKAVSKDGARDQLLVIAKPAVGRGQAGVYRVHWERLELVANAVRLARRHIFAGAETALIEEGLSGRPASAEVCLGVVSVLRHALKLQGAVPAAGELVGLQSRLCDRLAEWPEAAMGGALEVAFEGGHAADTDLGEDEDFDPVDKWAKKVTQNPIKGDAKSQKGDPASLPPTPPYKDTSPQGESTGAQTDARGEPETAVSGETADRRFGEGERREVHQLLTPQLFAALVETSGNRRAALLEALLGAHISEKDRVLTIRVASPALRDRVLELAGWAMTGQCGPGQRWDDYTVSVRRAS